MHHKKHHSEKHEHKHSGHSEPHGNPDKGPAMKEGHYTYDKGYKSDGEMSHGGFPEKHMRGNEYLKLQNEILSKDRAKLSRDKFTKIA